MNAYKAYKYYIALKAHFDSWSYDAIKYKLKSSASEESFVKRNDVLIFESISNKYGEAVGQYYIANFVQRVDRFLYDPLLSDRVYVDWQRRKSQKNRLVRQEILDLPYDNFEDIIATGRQTPILLREYLTKNVSPETLIILDSHYKFLDRWKVDMISDSVWGAVGITLCKYRSFVTFDKDMLSQILNTKFNQELHSEHG